jgi:hypothetical protein
MCSIASVRGGRQSEAASSVSRGRGCFGRRIFEGCDGRHPMGVLVIAGFYMLSVILSLFVTYDERDQKAGKLVAAPAEE